MTKREYKYHLRKKRKYGFQSYTMDGFTYKFYKNIEEQMQNYALFIPAKCQTKY